MKKKKIIILLLISIFLIQKMVTMITTTKTEASNEKSLANNLDRNAEKTFGTTLETVEFYSYLNEDKEILANNTVMLKDTENISEEYLEWNEFNTIDMENNYTASEEAKELVFADKNFYSALCSTLSEKIISYKENEDGTYSISMMQDDIENVTTLKLNNKSIENIQGIENFVNLKELDLFNNKITKIEDNLPNSIEYLELGNNKITTIDDITLPTNLKYLRLAYNTNLTNINIIFPKGLEELHLTKCYNIENLESMRFPETLKKLDLGECNNIGNLENIRGLKNLEILILWSCDIGDNLENIIFPTSLKELYIGNNGITNIDSLDNLINLTGLCIGSNNISNISVIENFSNLERLTAGDTYYIGTVGYFGEFGNQISNINNITFPNTIEWLDLGYNTITDISDIKWPQNLKTLILDNNLIKNISMEIGENCEYIDLQSNQISDISKIEVSSECFAKRTLILAYNEIKEIPQDIWQDSRIDVLVLNGNNISSIDNVIWPEKLDSLAIGDNNISSMNNIVWNENLRYLILNKNNITEINNITWPESLIALEIGENSIEDLSWIESATSLIGVALHKNKINNIESLSYLSKLQELHLNNNHIEDITPIESIANLSNLKLQNQEIIKVVDNSRENIELLPILKSTITEDSKVYTSNSMVFIKCDINENNIIFDSNDIGKIYIIVDGGNADGTVIFITGNQVEKIGDIVYQIQNKEELINFREIINNSSFTLDNMICKLMNDIDLGGYYNEETKSWEGEEWIPIGNEEYPFNYTFDGNGHKIIGLYINSEENYQGFFGYNAGTIKNLGIESGYVYSTGKYVGGISGGNYGTAIIEYCYNKADISGESYIGGVSGYNSNSYAGGIEISKCYNLGSISANGSYAAGILGSSWLNGIVDQCYNSGYIQSESYAAGIVSKMYGKDEYSTKVTNCFNAGKIESSRNAGIIATIAFGKNDIVKNCYNIGSIKTNGYYIGEIVGHNTSNALIENCYYFTTSDVKAINNKDDEENNVYGLERIYMRTQEFVDLLNNNDNDIWKLSEGDFKYPVFNWQTTYPNYKEEKMLSSISVTTLPIKIVYKAYEDFDDTGMVVTGIYDDGSEEEITDYQIIGKNDLTCLVNKVEIQDIGNTEIKTEVKITVSHNENIDKGKEPTCIEEGLTEGKYCSECNEVLVAQEIIPELGHNYQSKVIEATCIEKGYTTHKCARCEDEYVDSHTEALGHSFTKYTSDNNATCKREGTKTAKCDKCSETDTITEKGSMLPHTEVIDKVKEATCEETGLTKGKHCSECNTVLVEQEVIPAKGHTKVKDEGKEATCTETGLTEGKHCSECKEVLVEQEVIPAKGHTEVKDEGKEPTCTKEGLTEGKHCLECNKVLVEQKSISELGHNYEGGECTKCGEKETYLEVVSNTYRIEDTYISKVQEKTTVKVFKENIQTNATEIIVYNKDGETLEETQTLATEMQVELKYQSDTKVFTIAVAGDLNGDGETKFSDMSIVNRCRLNKKTLEGAYLLAADVTEDGIIDFKDLVKINRFRLHKITKL